MLERYEWDKAKNLQNIAKHHIDFVEAVLIFESPVLEKVDRRYGEERIAAIGITNGVELFVVYTWRGRNRRIISARRASRRERQKYSEILAQAREKEGED
ncbi:MAG TPA: BrnT family toxin [Candidatus Binataceae bacterium]|nr:BrnT family toxin [Candidatus Binataceae bacterium]